jgi:hypothetical protein
MCEAVVKKNKISGMARLCTQMSPLLDEDVLKSLHQREICTVVDILQERPDKLIKITKLSFKVRISEHA